MSDAGAQRRKMTRRILEHQRRRERYMCGWYDAVNDETLEVPENASREYTLGFEEGAVAVASAVKRAEHLFRAGDTNAG